MPVERREQVTRVELIDGSTACRMNPVGFGGRRQPSMGGTSRISREAYVRFCEGLGVKFPGPTRPRGRKLLEVPGYTFHVLVTTLSLDPVQTWRFYNSRAESENRLKELKEDFGADGFCLQSFYGTEAAFRLICFLFNLIADFKREVIRDESPRLLTLRTKVLVIGAILGVEGRHTVLRLGLRERWRRHFAVLLERVAALAISTVAQLTDYLKNPTPRPWKPRRPTHQQHLVLVPN
jgi:hypothetical protein